MNKTAKQIKKIKLKDDGLNGMEVTYMFPEEKDNMIWNNEYVAKRKHPIHGELEKAILDLRNFMLEICGYYIAKPEVTEKNYMIEESKIFEIQVTPESFRLSGEMRAIGDKFIKVSTPEIEIADGYEHFETVTKILSKVIEETHEYMAGKKRMSEQDFLERYAKLKGDDSIVKELKHMSAKEKKDYYTKALEKMGAIVIIDDEAEISEEDAQLEISVSNVEVEEEIIPISTPASEEPVIVVKEEEIIPVQASFVPQVPKMPAF